MGSVEEGLIRQHELDGTPIPAKIANAPTLYVGLEFYYKAFQRLTTERSTGFGPGRIPWSAVVTYCNEYEITGEQKDDMFYHIEAMDETYSSFVEKAKPDKGKIGG